MNDGKYKMRDPMKATMQQATEHNQNVLNVLTELLSVLRDADAIIGRDEEILAFDSHRTLAAIHGDIHSVFGSLSLIAGGEYSGGWNVFSQTQQNKDFFLLNIRSLLRESDFNNGFPLITDVCTLIEGLPCMPPEYALKVKIAHDKISHAMRSFRSKNSGEIEAAIFDHE
ncbi:hypothetical protein P5706_34980 [Pseudomonas sp. ChxA]|uniref:hypothetical protein n=1 Tax=Pseudomonas TaxID=286 RepID=UPI00128FECF0|nr:MULTISPECIES: hypothetical protein [Pseudomonas]MBJ2204263.1 hypothetical protein [Pseudomonas carnis]MBX9407813.1 hypothetical protein [Pseudomonas baetica]MDL2189376.1 hypothetical protein [Pseudomonas sp. ChxA]